MYVVRQMGVIVAYHSSGLALEAKRHLERQSSAPVEVRFVRPSDFDWHRLWAPVVFFFLGAIAL